MILAQVDGRPFFRWSWVTDNLDDIAARLNVSKPTVYYYVKNKEQILSEIFRTGLERLDAAWGKGFSYHHYNKLTLVVDVERVVKPGGDAGRSWLLIKHRDDWAGDVEYRRHRRPVCPPAERVHSRDQLGERERLGQVVVGAETEAVDPVADARRGRQHDHPSGAARRDDLPAHVVAVHHRQVAVQDHDVVRVPLHAALCETGHLIAGHGVPGRLSHQKNLGSSIVPVASNQM